MTNGTKTTTLELIPEKRLSRELRELRFDDAFQTNLKRVAEQITEEAKNFAGNEADRQQLMEDFVRNCGRVLWDDLPIWVQKAYFAIQGRTWKPARHQAEI